MYADVCVDAKGLIRRIAWTPKFHKHRSGGLVPRLGRLSSSPQPSVQAAGSRIWELLELWDYGCDVQISAPPDPITNRDDPSWSEIARDLWRLKREYKPTSPAPSDNYRRHRYLCSIAVAEL